ncbi:MAG: V-type ATPase subunit [Clostridia bacterium]|nr:V-type ATPase subunit [Clostridia bacterium]
MTDYLYHSARIRALECALLGRDRLEKILAADGEAVLTLLNEYGITPVTDAESGRLLREETLLGELHGSYAEIASLASDETVLRLWRYPYDCNNVKAAIKGFIRRIDPRSMMFDFGTLETETVIAMAQSGDFSALPPAMAIAADEAVQAFAKTKNPQQIDLLLDRACYADMLAAAERSGVAFAVALVREKIDLINLLIVVRILRMKLGESGKALLSASLLTGGNLSLAQLLSWFAAGESVMWDRLYYTSYGKLSEAVAASDRSLTAVERSADDFWMAHVKEAKYASFGPEVLIAFLQAHEYQVRNLRIILAGKTAGLPAETIRERIREGYV